ncbi:MAG: S46 family peptidase [Bacteroidetes bacterium]|nr:S46 family peptidase [Bacteroidota bacterium]
MLKIKFIVLIVLIGISTIGNAGPGEGMWIPTLLKQLNEDEMKSMGMRLTAEDIYDINNSSLKDAIVHFGGCTSEIISPEGLLLTNHHCGYGWIQRHSSVENDYLTNGFWAMSQEEELLNPGLKAVFIIRIEDVSEQVLEGVNIAMDDASRQAIIDANSAKLIKEATKDTHYGGRIRPFYYGNQHFMIITETFLDVRLVGAPPSSIGSFGGDTDNWMWPRHGGDFSLFRIYANRDNLPSEYNPDNVPYHPRHHLPISLNGIKKNDFTLVYGFPGRTNEYLTSFAIRLISEVSNPNKIKIREVKLNNMDRFMKTSDKIRIQYSSKYARVSNYHKKWQGENRGLKRLDAIMKKQELENAFERWANENNDRKAKYASLLSEFEKKYASLKPYTVARDYYLEAIRGIEILRFAERFRRLVEVAEEPETTQELLDKELERLRNSSKNYFKDYHLPVDEAIFAPAMRLYLDNVSSPDINHNFIPDILRSVDKKFKGDYDKYGRYIFKKSSLTTEVKLNALLDKIKLGNAKKMKKDPAYQLMMSFRHVYQFMIKIEYDGLNKQITGLNKIYMQALMEFQPEKRFYPDANSTLRVTYGRVDDYYPRDGVHLNYYTTLEGVIEKVDPDIYDYNVPEKLIELYEAKDYGDYGEDGKMHVCFIASNHTTGGNSGSPVINADGELIGLNFDRNWEGTMSDIMYDPDMCRNISVDIRYVLFITDKFAGASYLIDEMTLIKDDQPEDETAPN